MRRSLVVSLALLAIVRSQAVAQTCQGMASYSAGQMQVTGNAAFSDGVNSFGGTFGYGLPSGLYGNVGVSTMSIDALDASSTGIGIGAGYQMTVGKSKQLHLCPVASLGLSMGPKDIGGSGNDLSGRSAAFGLSLGTEMGANPRMRIIPAAGLSLAYAKSKIEDAAGTTVAEPSETFGLAQLAVGFVLNSQISVRPGISIPLGSDGQDTSFGVTVGYNFGSKGISKARRH
jgi:hypothetical protein